VKFCFGGAEDRPIVKVAVRQSRANKRRPQTNQLLQYKTGGLSQPYKVDFGSLRVLPHSHSHLCHLAIVLAWSRNGVRRNQTLIIEKDTAVTGAAQIAQGLLRLLRLLRQLRCAD